MSRTTMTKCKRTGTCICTTMTDDLFNDVDQSVEMRNTFLTADLEHHYPDDNSWAMRAENYDLFD